MTEDQLKIIEDRANAATKGPWRLHNKLPTACIVAGTQPVADGYSLYGLYRGLDKPTEQMVADGNFIAHSREDVPALIAEVRRLQKELETIYTDKRGSAEPAEI